MNKSTRLSELQNLLYVWMSKFEKRSLENIKNHCDFLNESYKLNLAYPNWAIFWPLVFNGLIDHVGKGYYALTAPIIIDCCPHYIYINHRPNDINVRQLTIGVFIANNLENAKNYSVIKINPLSVLKKYPSVKEIVDGFPKSLQDEKDLEYYNGTTRRGIAKLRAEGFTRYFSIPEEIYMRELPDRTINPEAFSVAYCYSRALNNESNGIYCEDSKGLSMPVFAFPYLLYRTLLIHSLSNGVMPEIKGKYYYFRNVPKSYVKQLNRIFCNSISYE